MNQVNRFFCFAHRLFERALLLVFPCLLLTGAPVHAQSTPDPSPSPCKRAQNAEEAEPFLSSLRSGPAEGCPANSSDASSSSTSTPGASPVTAGTPTQLQTTLINHRLLGVVTNYTTVETADHIGRLSAGTKFKLTAKTMTDPITVSFIGAVALLGQARNSDPTYGQGFAGYDKRFATFYADTGIGTLMTSSVFPAVLHQDPRYFQLGEGGFRRRLLHAMSSIIVGRSDAGATQFNYSQLIGNAVAAGIANTYHPESQRTLGNTLGIWASDTGVNMLCNIAKEFWPDIRSKLHRHKEVN